MGGGICPPPCKLAAPLLRIATTHMHNVYVHVEVLPVSMAKLSKSDILLILTNKLSLASHGRWQSPSHTHTLLINTHVFLLS